MWPDSDQSLTTIWPIAGHQASSETRAATAVQRSETVRARKGRTLTAFWSGAALVSGFGIRAPKRGRVVTACWSFGGRCASRVNTAGRHDLPRPWALRFHTAQSHHRARRATRVRFGIRFRACCNTRFKTSNRASPRSAPTALSCSKIQLSSSVTGPAPSHPVIVLSTACRLSVPDDIEGGDQLRARPL